MANFFFADEVHSTAYSRCVFFHSSPDVHLGRVRILANINNVAADSRVYVSL